MFAFFDGLREDDAGALPAALPQSSQASLSVFVKKRFVVPCGWASGDVVAHFVSYGVQCLHAALGGIAGIARNR